MKEIPKDWEVVTIADLGDVSTSSVDKKLKSDEKEINLINYMDVYNNLHREINSKIKFMRVTAKESQLKSSNVQKGDVLFTPTSETPDDIGISAVVTEELPNTLYSYHLLRLRFKREVDIKFKRYMFNNPIVLKQFSKIAQGATRFVLNRGDFLKVRLPLPPLPEQKKIAAILENVDQAIDETDKMIAECGRIKQELMKKILLKGLPNKHKRFKNVKVRYSPLKWEIPESWEITSLSKLTNKITDGTHTTPKYLDSGIPFLRVTDIQESKINLENVKHISEKEHQELCKRCKPEKGDILLSKNGTIGITYLIDFDDEFSIFVSLCLIKPNTSKIYPEFLLNILRSEIVFTQYKLRAKTGTVTNLHLEEIRELQIPLPTMGEQKGINDFINAFNKRLDTEMNNLKQLKKTKKALIQNLLTGKIRVKVN